MSIIASGQFIIFYVAPTKKYRIGLMNDAWNPYVCFYFGIADVLVTAA